MRGQVEDGDRLDHTGNLGRGGPGLHHDEHAAPFSLASGQQSFILAAMDEDHDAKPRDVESDLVEITSRLGEPDSTHRTNTGSVVWRFVLGVIIVIAAAVLHYLMWTETIP